MKRSISAIIVNFNGGEFLPRAIDSLRAQTLPPDEIVVVDNASTDRSRELLKEMSGIVVIESDVNVGFAQGCNLGFAHSRGDYIALLNSDAIAEPGWLGTLADILDQREQIAAAMGKIRMAHSPSTIDQAGAFFNNLGNYWGRGYGEIDRGQYESEEEVPGITACAALIRRAALHSEQPFDPDLFMYGEELDLSIRLRMRGYGFIYTPLAVVHHGGMSSVQKSHRDPRMFQQFLSNRNRMKILLRHFPLRTLVPSSHLIVMGIIYWNLVFLFRGGPRLALRALAAQLRFALLGLRERHISPDSAHWLAWMTRQGLADVLRQKQRMEAGDPLPRAERSDSRKLAISNVNRCPGKGER